MKTTKLHLLGMVMLCSTYIFGQEKNEPFHSISEHNHRRRIEIKDNDMSEGVLPNINIQDSMLVDTAQGLKIVCSDLSIEQLEKLIVLYKDYIHQKRERNTLIKETNQQILKYYNGESYELTLANLIDVINEVGLNNQLFVLAQAVLETGHFISPVCKNYHNLFGLYDSKHKDYYRLPDGRTALLAIRNSSNTAIKEETIYNSSNALGTQKTQDTLPLWQR